MNEKQWKTTDRIYLINFYFMKKTLFYIICIFFLFSCSKKETVNILQKELENKNTPQSQTLDNMNSLKNDFQKDLDTILEQPYNPEGKE